MQNIQDFNLKKIDEVRQDGYRPVVVGCFVFNEKLLMVYKKKHDLWQLPQGGVDNQEILSTAIKREMEEELGKEFKANFDQAKLIGLEKVDFPFATKGSRNLVTDTGNEIIMQGKIYFFIALEAHGDDLNIQQTEFDDYKWLGYNQALALTDKIYQRGKQRITIQAINLLKENNYIK